MNYEAPQSIPASIMLSRKDIPIHLIPIKRSLLNITQNLKTLFVLFLIETSSNLCFVLERVAIYVFSLLKAFSFLFNESKIPQRYYPVL